MSQKLNFNNFFFWESNITGVAINTDEYVPIITPTIRANIKPRIDSPPNKKIASNTNRVVKEVFNVLLKKLNLGLNLQSETIFSFWLFLVYSLILSKTTTVSFNEVTDNG